MMRRRHRILITENEEHMASGLKSLLTSDGYRVTVVANGTRAYEKLLSNEFAALVAGLNLPDIDGIKLLSLLKARGVLSECIFLTGGSGIAAAVEAMKLGAYDVLAKPLHPQRLRAAVRGALNHYELVVANRGLNGGFRGLQSYEGIIGGSEEMRQVYKLIDAVADTTSNVVITGESGTGKELVARAIHSRSSRRDGPFVAVNCSAFPMEILENELFGHEQGAFTGAIKEKAGCFELAHTGTLFLDEICDMPTGTQAKILRALEGSRFRRLGGKKEIEVDVRVLSASNKRLEQAVEEKTLREDIYYRLSVVEIELPPLRERVGDIPLLLQEFLRLFNQRNNKSVSAFSDTCFDLLNRYQWPGNVRELKNAVERAVVLCEDRFIDIQHLPKRLVNSSGEKLDIHIPLGTSLAAAERELILETLELVGQNKTRAARILGISLKTLHNKLNLYRSGNAI